MRSVPIFLGLLAPLVAIGCTTLREAPSAPVEDGGGPNDDDDAATSITDASTSKPDAGGDGPPETWSTYDEAQQALAAKRSPGPLTAQGSTGYCTANHFVWRDSDGKLHSWSAATQTQTDYTFKAPQNRPFFVPSDSYVIVDVAPTYAEIALYETGKPNALVTKLPYAYAYAAGDAAVIRADQRVDNVDLGGTKVRRWNAAGGKTEDISPLLPTPQPPASFANDEIVIPEKVTIPHLLHIVNVKKKTTSAVTFDDALGAHQILPSPEGLLVAYARSGGTAIRLYRGNDDAAASRYEVGDDLANRPPLFSDSPATEHTFVNRIAMHGRVLLYGSSFGIFAYSFESGALAPIQLGPNKTVFVPDVMCVVRDRSLLVYRLSGDKLGQIWTVPLASVIP